MRREVIACALSALAVVACSKRQESTHAFDSSKLCDRLMLRLSANEQSVGSIADPKCPALAKAANDALGYKNGIEEMFGTVVGASSQEIGIVADFTHATGEWAIESAGCAGAGNPEQAAAAAVEKAKKALAEGKASLAARCAHGSGGSK